MAHSDNEILTDEEELECSGSVDPKRCRLEKSNKHEHELFRASLKRFSRNQKMVGTVIAVAAVIVPAYTQIRLLYAKENLHSIVKDEICSLGVCACVDPPASSRYK